MEEFDYLVTWVKELCDEDEKDQIISALLVAEVDVVRNDGLPTFWAYIYKKIEKEIGSNDGLEGHVSANPRYVGFLELCKKNSTLVDELKDNLGSVGDAGLDSNLTGVVKMRYPGWIKSSWKPWVQESNETLESENTQPANLPNQPVPIKNVMSDNHDVLQKKFVR